MRGFDEVLAARGVVVLDGAMATELERRGADLDDPLWSAKVLLEAPERIRAVHAAWFEAGADVATTASYQASFEGFARRGIDEAGAADLMGRSVRLAREAAGATGLVAASVGPYGAFLADGSEYRGDYGLGEAELARFHERRLDVLAAAGPDLLACETIPTAVEARALAALLADRPGARAWFSFTLSGERTTSAGEPLADVARFLDSIDAAVAIGVNCVPPRLVEPAIRELRRATGKPIVVYPNSGETWSAEARDWRGAPAADLGALARAWIEAGARLVGGCCRTTPEDVRRIARAVRGG